MKTKILVGAAVVRLGTLSGVPVLIIGKLIGVSMMSQMFASTAVMPARIGGGCRKG